MIRLLELTLVNFMSHVNTRLDFRVYEGLVLVEGKNSSGFYNSNGAGKSTLLEGIVYALTGDTLRGVAVNDIVNRNHKKDTRVSLTFLKDDVEYTVIRYRKDTKMGDSLVLMRGDEDISKRVNKETQKVIEDVLGISYRVLVSTVLLGEGLSSRFTQLSDPEKKSLIESTLNLNYDFGKLRDKSNSRLKSLKLESASLDGEISVLEGFKDEDVEMLEDSIYDNQSLINISEETSAHIKEEYDKVSMEISLINPKLQVINDALARYNALSTSHDDLMRQIQHYQEERERVATSSSPVCSLCRQALQSLESKSAVLSNYDSNLKEVSSKLEQVESELLSIPPKQVLDSKVSDLSREYNDKLSKSQDLMRDYNSYQVKIAEANKDIEVARKSLEQASDCSIRLEEKKSKKHSVDKESMKFVYFYDLFSPTGIIVHILADAIEYINSRLSVYSEVLLEKDYHLEFLKGKISLVDSKGSSYQSLSNGEKRRLDISIQFALHDYVTMYCGMKIDCCYIDEILDTLDDIGVDNIFDILRLKMEYCHLKSIYVITHNSALKDKFDRVITIKKHLDGDSHIE